MQDQFHRQQGNDAECHRTAGKHHSEEIEKARPDHGKAGRQGVGVDHGGDCVGRVMKAVDELEAQGDQQRYAQQHERGPGGDHRAHVVNVLF